MITLESIKKKLGFDPLDHDYWNGDPWLVDDRPSHLYDSLSIDEIHFLYELAVKSPEAWKFYPSNQEN